MTVIGLREDAGKTTAMCHLMTELGKECLSLASVGRDEECTDLITGTEKPGLYLKKSDLFAMARGMLTLCDATLEVVDFAGATTSLGPVAVFRILPDRYVQPAGPSAAEQLLPLTRRFQELGAQRVLIGGAVRHKSLAGTGVGGVALLCTDMFLDRDMELVVAETARTYWLFARKRSESAALCTALDGQEARFALFIPEGELVELPLGYLLYVSPSPRDIIL